MEEWKRIYINGTETVYEISSTGRCRNITKKSWKTKGVLRPRVNNKSGYVQYCIVHQSKKYYMYAHRLVATYSSKKIRIYKLIIKMVTNKIITKIT